MKILLTVKEGADALGLSQSKLYQIIAAGQIGIVKIGRSSRIPVSEIHRFVGELPLSGAVGIVRRIPGVRGSGGTNARK